MDVKSTQENICLVCNSNQGQCRFYVPLCFRQIYNDLKYILYVCYETFPTRTANKINVNLVGNINLLKTQYFTWLSIITSTHQRAVKH